MSKRFWMPRWFANHCLSGAGRELSTLIVLANHANKEGLAWPSVQTISRTIGATKRCVRGHLRLLEKKGLIAPISSKSGGQHSNSTRYRLFFQTHLEYQKALEPPKPPVVVPPDDPSDTPTEESSFPPTEDKDFPPVDNLLITCGKQAPTEEKTRRHGGKNASGRGNEFSSKVIIRSNSMKGNSLGKEIGNDKNGTLKGTAKTAEDLTNALTVHLAGETA